jgi:hypothetical protein
VWSTFSDGGEIQWIRDANLLADLATAYGQIKYLKELNDVIMRPVMAAPMARALASELDIARKKCKILVANTLERIEQVKY